MKTLAALRARRSREGCGRNSAAPAPTPPEVDVAKPVVREVTEWDEYTGRLAAIDTVEIRARVSGYLQSVNFKEGQIVKKGDLLFVIDPRPYRAALSRAEGELASAQASLVLAENDAKRAERLVQADVVSRERFETQDTRQRTVGRAGGDREGGRGAVAAGPGVHRGARAHRRPHQQLRPHRRQPGQRRRSSHDHRLAGSHLLLLRRQRAGLLEVHAAGRVGQPPQLARRRQPRARRPRRRGRVQPRRAHGLRGQPHRSAHRHDPRPRGAGQPRRSAHARPVRETRVDRRDPARRGARPRRGDRHRPVESRRLRASTTRTSSSSGP